jgi:hypothetical protein
MRRRAQFVALNIDTPDYNTRELAGVLLWENVACGASRIVWGRCREDGEGMNRDLWGARENLRHDVVR